MSGHFRTLAMFFFYVCLQISPQMACLRKCKIILNLFVWLFPLFRETRKKIFFLKHFENCDEKENWKFNFSRAKEKLSSHFFSRFFFEIETLVNDCCRCGNTLPRYQNLYDFLRLNHHIYVKGPPGDFLPKHWGFQEAIVTMGWHHYLYLSTTKSIF